MATTPVQGQIVSTLPDAGWGDSTLVNWYNQNKGKYYWDAQGDQKQIPTSGNPNAGQIRGYVNQGTFQGMQTTDPAAAQTAQTAQAAQAAQAQAATAAGGAGGAGGTAAGVNSTNSSGATPMANSYYSPTTGQPQVSSQDAINYYAAMGGNPNIDAGTAMSYFTAKNPNFGASGVDPQAAINYYVQQGGNPKIDPATAVSFYEAQHPQELAKGVADAAKTPEQRALEQMAQTDPNTEALRNQLSGSYSTSLAQGAKPSASDFQSYLDTYKQVDPTDAAGNAALSKQLSDQVALGSQLDPVTARQVEQATRAGQVARGNVYGTPQMVQEAMTTGQAGLALQQQRQQAMQSYLGSGVTQGDIALNMYNQGQANLRSNQQATLGYLGSGSTPYQAGASYLSAAEGNAAQAAQGGPQYNPASLGNVSGQQQQQYGLDIGSQAQNYFNSLNNAYAGGAGGKTKNQTAAALGGAASGAIAGIPAAGATYGGSVVGGAIAGGLSGYYS
jgi:hypothetical protein